jgi:hypothetical protein
MTTQTHNRGPLPNRRSGFSAESRTTIRENFVFLRKFSNAEAWKTQSFAEFNFLSGPRRPLHLCVKASRRLVAAIAATGSFMVKTFVPT